MICPKCKCEYWEQFTWCTNCDTELIQSNQLKPAHINSKDISLIKYGIALLIFIIFQVVAVAVVILYEFYWVYRLGHGGIAGTVLGYVHPLIWFLFIIQVIIAIGILCWGAGMKEYDN